MYKLCTVRKVRTMCEERSSTTYETELVSFMADGLKDDLTILLEKIDWETGIPDLTTLRRYYA